jgi:hypothetical protein
MVSMALGRRRHRHRRRHSVGVVQRLTLVFATARCGDCCSGDPPCTDCAMSVEQPIRSTSVCDQ